MSALDDAVAVAVARGHAPFVVAAVADRDGLRWQGAAGMATADHPAAQDTLMRVYSMTKAVCGVAAGIAIDRGQLSLDAPVAAVLPAFAEVEYVQRGPDAPRRAPATPVTFGQLLSHTSGLSFEGMSWTPPASGEVWQGQPLAFDPGTRWSYGMGCEWAGLVIAKVDGRSVAEFCRAEIFEPLGMHDTTFTLEDRSRLADVRMRAEDGRLQPYEVPAGVLPEDWGLGGGLYSTADDVMRVLRLVLGRGEVDGIRLISEAAADAMLDNQIGDVRVAPTPAELGLRPVDYLRDSPLTYTTAFLRNEADIPARRRAGSLTWAGMANTHFWVDPASRLAAVFMTQSLPFCDPQFMGAYEAFERAVYRRDQ